MEFDMTSYLEEERERQNMQRVDRIYRHPSYQAGLMQNKNAEKHRIYCRHNIQHFLDVARLAWIYNLERGLQLKKEMVYAAALLHDIGRFRQYEEGIAHDVASAELAEQILPDAGFSEKETEEICDAILKHRNKDLDEKGNLGDALRWADKKARRCYACEAEKTCYWKEEKKNLNLTW